MSALRDFLAVYRLYRNHHSFTYAVRQAWNISVRAMPF